MNSSYSIIADKLTKTFGDFTAVDAISLEVKSGEIFGFLGANGAGKTTQRRARLLWLGMMFIQKQKK